MIFSFRQQRLSSQHRQWHNFRLWWHKRHCVWGPKFSIPQWPGNITTYVTNYSSIPKGCLHLQGNCYMFFLFFFAVPSPLYFKLASKRAMPCAFLEPLWGLCNEKYLFLMWKCCRLLEPVTQSSSRTNDQRSWERLRNKFQELLRMRLAILLMTTDT